MTDARSATAGDGPAGGSANLRADAARAVRGTALLAVAQVGSRGIGFVFTLVLARLLDLTDFGTYNLVLALLVYGQLLQDGGLSKLVLREVATAPETADSWIERLLPLRVLCGLFMCGLVPVVVGVAGYPPRVIGVAALAALILPPFNIWLLCEGVAQGRGAVPLLAAAYLVNTALQAGLGMAAALAADGELHLVVTAMVLANALSVAFIVSQLRRAGVAVRWRPRWIDPTPLLREALPFLGIAAVAVALGRVETILVGRIAGTEEVALFAVAFKFFETMLFVLFTVQIVLNPAVARHLRTDRAALSGLLAWVMGAVCAALVPVCTVLALASGWIITLVLPARFAPAAGPTAILFACVPLAAIQVLAAGALTLSDRQRETLLALLGVLAVQIGVDLWLIPAEGRVGAAVGIAVGQSLGAAVTLTLARRWLLPDSRALLAVLRVAGATVAGAAAFWATRDAGPWLAGVTAFATYGIALAVARLRLFPPAALST